MRRIPACALVAIAAAALSACGGGDDAATPQSAALSVDFKAYAGTWATCGEDDATNSVLHQLTITQASEDKFHYRWLETLHASPDCSGPGTFNDEEQADVVAQGKTTTVDGLVVQRVSSRVTRGGQVVEEDQVVLMTPEGLRIGDPASKDPDGTLHLFPNPFKPAQFIDPAPAPEVATPPPPPPAPAPAPAPVGDTRPVL